MDKLSKRLCVLDANAFWTQQLFQECGRFANVLLLKPRDFRAHQKTGGSIWSDSQPRQLLPTVWEQRLSMPPGWIFNLWPLARRKVIAAVRRYVGDNPFTLVLTYPQYRSLIPALKPAQSLYYNFDDYRDNWPGREAQIPVWERELVELADDTVCIANHRASVLRKQHPAKASRIHHIPIGCTPGFMAAPEDRRQKMEDRGPQAQSSVCRPLPSALGSLPRPLAGYIGALNWRFDYVLLAEVAQQLPEVTFALGGKPPSDTDGDAAWQAGLQRARSLPNVHFLGWVDHTRLGEFLNNFDVLFMSYSHCNFNTNACPAKLWDYFGTGLPMVANVANPETLLWREAVHIGETPKVFVEKFRQVLRGEPLGLRERRLAIAREHTWEQLSHRMESILMQPGRPHAS